MIELTWVRDALQTVGVLYWLAALGVLLLVLAFAKPVWGKALGILVVIVLFGYMPGKLLWENKIAADTRKAAIAHFEMRCKGAGEKIYKTVNDVEGIFLLKVRPDKVNFSYQFALDDPYGRDLGGNGYIQTFIRGSFQAQTRGTPIRGAPPRIGYRYVEAIDQKDGKRYRYTGSIKAVGKKDATAPNVRADLKRNPNFDLNIYAFVLERVPALGPAPRYGVTYDDISTREDREYWIAGSSLKIIDLKTNEVIAERIGYMMDPQQGNTSGGRSPWLLAANHACPSFQRNLLRAPGGHGASSQAHQTQDFVEKVLHIKQEN